ncbi:hypothetical protein HJB88_03430 [Rhizobium sp. NZLR5]|uniref:hypothetical protein n=1 Tax=Rhizobium sp. NZLR5 TaxID=2731103 RepID=UPI001C840465|nr:hypothetical protein [Rhizobium sp. NZLR5]MBX5181697.1 hypothetical protein [Rhizobium sp. NZLR5]
MPFVSRTNGGAINGLFEQWQEGHADEFLPDDDPAIIAFLASTPAYYRISKMTPWLRMTDAEADIMTTVMGLAPARLRAIYNAAPYLQSDDPLWPTLREMLSSSLSSRRASELLAPETGSI